MELVNKYPYRSKDAIFKIVDNQAIVLSAKEERNTKDEFFILNSTGTRIWNLLDGKRSAQDVIHIICKEFDITNKKKAEEKILEFFVNLAKKGLISLSIIRKRR